MTVAAKITLGNKIFMNPAPTAATLLVAELLSLDPPNLSRGTIDATTHDSAGGAEEVIGEGTYDPGEVKGQVNYIAASPGDQAFITAITSNPPALQNVKLHVKTATGWEAWSFQGYVTSYSPDGMPVKGKQTASFSIKVTGAHTHASVP